MFAVIQGVLAERLTSALWPDYLDNKAVMLGLLERLDVIVRQSARLSCSVSSVSRHHISARASFEICRFMLGISRHFGLCS